MMPTKSMNLEDWQIEFKGQPVGMLGDTQFSEGFAFPEYESRRFQFGETTFDVTLKKVHFNKIAKALGMRGLLVMHHEWSEQCRKLRRKLKAAQS